MRRGGGQSATSASRQCYTVRGVLITCLLLFTVVSLTLNFLGFTSVKFAYERASTSIANYGIARCEERNEKPIVYLHFHKAMGTSICGMAKEIECITARQRRANCNLYVDGIHTDPASKGLTCAERLTMGQELKQSVGISPSFYGVERFMDPEICHDSFTYLVVFREPLARIASHWAYQYKSSNKGDIPATIFEDVQYYAPKDKDWTATSKTTLNNFYIRTLLGLEAYTTHDYINETHLIKAKTRLSQFDYVLIQERFSEAGVVFASLGWTEQYVHMAMLGNRRNVHSHSTFEHAFAPDEAEWLVEHNILDQRLYSFAESLFDTLLSQISQ